MPQFLADTGYANPTDPANCPAQPGLRTDLTLFQWLPQHPRNFDAFNQWMAFQLDWKSTCFDVFPVEEQLLKGATAETPVFVDVGGGEFTASNHGTLAINIVARSRSRITPTSTRCTALADIRAGIGQQCIEFRRRFPDAPGRVILQDLPHVVEQAMPHDGVEKMGHSFFTPQPVKGISPVTSKFSSQPLVVEPPSSPPQPIPLYFCNTIPHH